MADVTYVNSMATTHGQEVKAWYQQQDGGFKIVVYVDNQTVSVSHIPGVTREQAAANARSLVAFEVEEINNRTETTPETKYQVVKHDLTHIQWDITTAQPGTFYDPASAELYAQMLQMTAPDVRVQYIVEVVSDETLRP